MSVNACRRRAGQARASLDRRIIGGDWSVSDTGPSQEVSERKFRAVTATQGHRNGIKSPAGIVAPMTPGAGKQDSEFFCGYACPWLCSSASMLRHTGASRSVSRPVPRPKSRALASSRLLSARASTASSEVCAAAVNERTASSSSQPTAAASQCCDAR